MNVSSMARALLSNPKLVCSLKNWLHLKRSVIRAAETKLRLSAILASTKWNVLRFLNWINCHCAWEHGNKYQVSLRFVVYSLILVLMGLFFLIIIDHRTIHLEQLIKHFLFFIMVPEHLRFLSEVVSTLVAQNTGENFSFSFTPQCLQLVLGAEPANPYLQVCSSHH